MQSPRENTTSRDRNPSGRRWPWIVAGAAVVASIGLAATTLVAAPESGSGTPDVILMRCDTSGSNFKVTAYQQSASAPSSRSTSCAENLSYLARDGFSIVNVGNFDFEKSGYSVYFLSR